MIFVALLWALCFPLLRVGLASGTSPLLFGALRTAIASIVLAGLAFRRRERISETGNRKLVLAAIGATVFFGIFRDGPRRIECEPWSGVSRQQHESNNWLFARGRVSFGFSKFEKSFGSLDGLPWSYLYFYTCV
jgi:hypothetical protein